MTTQTQDVKKKVGGSKKLMAARRSGGGETAAETLAGWGVGAGEPVRIEIEVRFAEGSRKVTYQHLEDAARVAAAGVRASLEGRVPEYRLAAVLARVEYSYVKFRRTLRG